MKLCAKCTPSVEEKINKLEQDNAVKFDLIEKKFEGLSNTISDHLNKLNKDYRQYMVFNIEKFKKNMEPNLKELGKYTHKLSDISSEFQKKIDELHAKIDKKINKFW